MLLHNRHFFSLTPLLLTYVYAGQTFFRQENFFLQPGNGVVVSVWCYRLTFVKPVAQYVFRDAQHSWVSAHWKSSQCQAGYQARRYSWTFL